MAERQEAMEHRELSEQLRALHEDSYGWALNCCFSHPEDAEDILHTAYHKILEGRARFDGRADFKTWLFAVIRHTAADERRRGWWKFFRFGGSQEEMESVAEKADPGEALQREERMAAFREALGGLPQRQREILHLVFYQDLTVEAAAEVMGVGLGSARTHYARAKEALRERLKSTNLSEVQP